MSERVTGSREARSRVDYLNTVHRRRVGFFVLTGLLTLLVTASMAEVSWLSGIHPAWIVVLLVPFAILAGALSISFCQALVGFFLIRSGGDPCRISLTVDWNKSDPGLSGKTAIAMPIFNEDVSGVFQRIKIMRRSLDATGIGTHFDFFVLSDSDIHEKWIEEEVAWASLFKATSVNGSRVFYRHRSRPVNNKSGNIADFCRRWGKSYQYMIVLDADSFMTGPAMLALARIMEANPTAGIIQSMPRLMGAKTVFARAQQFAFRLYSHILAAGANFWQQGDGNFWGHNAIIRLAPFMAHCALPKLPGTGAFSGRILSHDFVEAALMQKAGWKVWTAYELEGSYEGAPPTMLDHLVRDRRWCQGNLQHLRLFFARGIRPISRLHLLMGVLAYTASPLLVSFIFLSLIAGATAPHHGPGALLLYLVTMGMIFGAKILGVISMLASREETKSYGGSARALTGVVCETMLSIFVAPIFLWYHTKFVLFTLLGRRITWTSQNRGGAGDFGWRTAAAEHGVQTFSGCIGAILLASCAPGLFWWFSPLLAGLVFSIPISFLSSLRMMRGNGLGAGLFHVPEEINPAPGLKYLPSLKDDDEIEEVRRRRTSSVDSALTRAIIDPYTNAVHISLLRDKRMTNPSLESLCKRLVRLGPESLTLTWKKALLRDRRSMIWLHRELWITPANRLPDWWRIARRDVVASPSRR